MVTQTTARSANMLAQASLWLAGVCRRLLHGIRNGVGETGGNPVGVGCASGTAASGYGGGKATRGGAGDGVAPPARAGFSDPCESDGAAGAAGNDGAEDSTGEGIEAT